MSLTGETSRQPIHGNYHAYYYKRENLSTSIDPRLLLLPPDTFKGKRVLDIGCNEGWVTIDIAQRFSPAKIIGVDIDASLIGAAWKRRRFMWSLQNTSPSATDHTSPSESEHDQSTRNKKRKRMDLQNAISKDPSSAFFSNVDLSPGRSDVFAYFPQSMEYMFGPLPMPLPSSPNASPEIHYPFPHNVTFYTADWMGSTRGTGATPSNEVEMGQTESSNAAIKKEDREGYDVVLALSITKWIHIHNGDEGLIAFFRKIHSVLRKGPDRRGGLLILEPQEWDSYTQVRKMNSEMAELYKALKLRPTDFPRILEEIGFREEAIYAQAGIKEIKRSLVAYRKV
ncbi:Bin3-domain-containing protein [Serendipita vermifera]|nr:Bin3-domain-containing protein [Serendipita vermifera]